MFLILYCFLWYPIDIKFEVDYMCKVLMSINPEYVEKILSGSKKYEY